MDKYTQLENRIKELEKWKTERTKQQIVFPLDIQSLEILRKYFLYIKETITIINEDYPGSPSLLDMYLAKQDTMDVDFRKSKIFSYIANISTDFLAIEGNKNWVNGTRLFFMTSDTAPTPIDTTGATDYYVVGTTGKTFQISLTPGGAAIDITDVGVGRQFIYSYIEP